MLHLKEKLDSTLRAAIWGAAAAAAAVTTVFFLCAAAFVWTGRNYGPVAACLVLAAVFLVFTCGAAIALLINRRAQAKRAKARNTAVNEKWWLDPMVAAAGVQAGKTLGAHPLVPLLVVAAFFVCSMLSRSNASKDPAPPG
jgi:fatty acid desaturase